MVRGGAVEVPALKQSVQVAATLPEEGTALTVGLRPEHLEIGPGETLSVELTEALGGVSYAYLNASTGERLIVEERGDERSSAGDSVGLSFEGSRAYLFERETGARIR